eukprot:6976-Eustigmatos_ZCMA.PRE.1
MLEVLGEKLVLFLNAFGSYIRSIEQIVHMGHSHNVAVVGPRFSIVLQPSCPRKRGSLCSHSAGAIPVDWVHATEQEQREWGNYV